MQTGPFEVGGELLDARFVAHGRVRERTRRPRLERVDLAYQIGKRPSAAFTGPWVFRFELPPIRESADRPTSAGILANHA